MYVFLQVRQGAGVDLQQLLPLLYAGLINSMCRVFLLLQHLEECYTFCSTLSDDSG